MAKACKKCDPHEICEECPEWIFTLADLIMCMMGLFVILWVLKPSVANDGVAAAEQPKQQEEWLNTIGEIRSGFGWEPDPQSSDPVDQAVIRKQKRQNGPENQGTSQQKPDGAEGSDPEVTSVRPGDQAIVGTRLGFGPGESTLAGDDIVTLNQIVAQIKGHRSIVLIKGHASLDDFSDTGTPEQFMDISIKRAQTVSDYLTRHGVSPDVVRVQGCSTFEPLKERAYSPEEHRKNRRVDVEATNTLVRELQDGKASAMGD